MVLYTVQCTVLYGTVLYGTVLYGAVLYGAVLYGAVLYGAVLYGTVLYVWLSISLKQPLSWGAEKNMAENLLLSSPQKNMRQSRGCFGENSVGGFYLYPPWLSC